MKIAVVGCGALGSYYGAHVLRAGAEVHFLLRSDYATVLENGLSICSENGNFTVRPQCWRESRAIGICDLVLIGLKTTANSQFSTLLPPLVGPNTVLLTLQNGLGNEAALAALFGDKSVMGGLCFVCLNRIEPGVIQHLGYGQIILGEYKSSPRPRTEEIAELFRRSRIPCQVTEDLEQSHWEKLVWNIPFNGLGVAAIAGFDAVVSGKVEIDALRGSTFPTDQLLSCGDWSSLVRELMDEIIAVARESGFPVAPAYAETLIARTRKMGAYKASTLIDFERGQPIELDSMFVKPLRHAQSVKVPTPRLATLCEVLAKLDPASTNPG